MCIKSPKVQQCYNGKPFSRECASPLAGYLHITDNLFITDEVLVQSSHCSLLRYLLLSWFVYICNRSNLISAENCFPIFLYGQLTFSTDISYSKFWETSIALAPKISSHFLRNTLNVFFKGPLLSVYSFNSTWPNDRNPKESITLCRYSDILNSYLSLQFSEKVVVRSVHLPTQLSSQYYR